MKSSKTDPSLDHESGARAGNTEGTSKSRGVEHPIPEDMALIGDTRHSLHTAPLPRRMGPNFGHGEQAPSDQLRVDCGEGLGGEL